MGRPFHEDPVFQPFRRTLPQGEVLSRQGEREGHSIAVLVKGILEVTKDGYLVGEVMEPGSILGEMSMVLGSLHTATITALTKSELIVIPRDKLNAVAKKIPEFSMRIMRTLASRLEQANTRIAELENSYDQLYNQMESGSVSDTVDSGLFNADTLVLRQSDEFLAAVEECDAADSATLAAIKLPDETPDGKQPLIIRQVRCPAHMGEDAFPVYFLRRFCQEYRRDAFGITEYERGKDGYASIDYSLQDVHVCPVCHFASNMPDNFIPVSTTRPTGTFTIRTSVRELLNFGMDVRRALVQTLPDQGALFGSKREVREAMVAFELALMTARTFFESDRKLFSTWGFRLIVYNLKIAQIQRRYRSKETEEVYLGRAYDLVKQHLGSFNGAQYFYTYFLSVALGHRLVDAKQAGRHFEEFCEVRKQATGRLDAHLEALANDYLGKASGVVETGQPAVWDSPKSSR